MATNSPLITDVDVIVTNPTISVLAVGFVVSYLLTYVHAFSACF